MSHSQSPPDWVQFLAAAVRLVDLHDSQMVPGGRSIQAASEERRGGSQGVFVSVGWALLEELRDAELEGRFDYVDIIPFARRIMAAYGVEEVDVKQIAVILSTPTELEFQTPSDHGPVARAARNITPLIDKQARGYRCRLTPKGREALQFAAGYLHWVHVGVESRKLLIDLEMREYGSFLHVARRIYMQLRDQSAEIIRAIEQPEAAELLAHFQAHHDRYLTTLDEVVGVMRDVQRTLLLPETAQSVDAWAEHNDDGATAAHLLYLAREVSGAAAMLQRRFSRLIIDVQGRAPSGVASVRFGAMASMLLRSPDRFAYRQKSLERLMDRLGPVMVDNTQFHPLDLAEIVNLPKPKPPPASAAKQRVDGQSVSPPALEAFVAANRGRLIEILHTGALRLSDFVEDAYELDFTPLGEDGVMVDGLGVFIAPLVLGLDEASAIAIRPLAPGAWRTPDGWRVSGNDLEFRLVERADD